MDRKALIVLVISFLFMVLWFPLMNRLYPRKVLPATTNTVLSATNGTPTLRASTQSAEAPIVSIRPAASASASLVTLTNDTAIYTFSSLGGGLQLVELRAYPENVVCRRKGVPTGSTNFASLNHKEALPVLSMGGGTLLTGVEEFKLTAEGGRLRAETTLSNGLAVSKEFSLGSNYLVHVRVRLENQSGAALVLPEQDYAIGTAVPMGTNDTGENVGVFWYDGSRAEDVKHGWFENRGMGCMSGSPRTEFRGGMNNVAWGAVHNQFFTLAVMPSQPASHVVARMESITNDASGTRVPVGRSFPAFLVYPSATLTNGQILERDFTIYAGPKEYNTLARIGNERKNNLDLVMDFGRFFGFFAKSLLLSMNGLHALSLPYGLAIVLITVIIKLLFWPLTTASTRSMKRMQKLQPQMKLIQEKYKEDPRKMNTKMMEFMKEHKVSPLGGCLPMLLQIPVFIGFYQMLQSAIELRGASFLWACDLSQPDTVFSLGGFPVNPMPMIMGVTMLWQARLTPAAPGMDPVQQKIMKYMPLMFIVFLYKMSSGLTLYWTVQNLLSIAQMKLTKTVDEPAPGVSAPVAPRAIPPKRKK